MERLKESLENLHKELNNADSVDEKSREILFKLMDDIHSLLERSEEVTSEEHNNLLQDLKASAGKFEVSHPELYGAIKIVINSFSNIGV